MGLENPPNGIQRSRRNLINMGAIAASAIFAGLMKTTPAAAGPPGPPPGPPGPPPGPSCFLKGTTIRTADGDSTIEDLAVGDLLPSFFGGTRPIQWIGRYSFKESDPTKAWVKDVLPVRVARSALGPNVPHADLCITKGHALLIDGVLGSGRIRLGPYLPRQEARHQAREQHKGGSRKQTVHRHRHTSRTSNSPVS